MLQPEKLREIIFLLLFGMSQHKENDEKELMNIVMHELKVSRSSVRSGLETCHKIMTALEKIDAMISDVLLSFSLERIQNAEMAILRLSFWEIFIQKTVPPKVILSEAKRLAKKFADDEAPRFILAILINACEKQGVEISEPELKISEKEHELL